MKLSHDMISRLFRHYLSEGYKIEFIKDIPGISYERMMTYPDEKRMTISNVRGELLRVLKSIESNHLAKQRPEEYRLQCENRIDKHQLALVEYVDISDGKTKLGFVFSGDRTDDNERDIVYDEYGFQVEYSDIGFVSMNKHFYIYKPTWSPKCWTVNITDTDPNARC